MRISWTLLVGALAACWLAAACAPRSGGDTGMGNKPLTPFEEQVMLHKATEPPFSGRFVNHHEKGVYECRRCGAALFPSSAKFDSHSGWPSFDDAYPGAVRQIPDADGVRTEIVCANCGAHLGHVFFGERFTDRNTRLCVNSASLDFSPAAADAAVSAVPTTTATAYFAGGCFWGVEHHFDGLPGVISAVSGYMGGRVDAPSYQDVCTGRTGHAETVKVTYDPHRVAYEELAKLFFEIHDPTEINRQGPDVGEQYRSVVFYIDREQQRVAARLIDQLKAKGLRVATQLIPAGAFWTAEDYHQDYYAKQGGEPYCHVRVKRFD